MWCKFYGCWIQDVNFIIDSPVCDMCCGSCDDNINPDEDRGGVESYG